MRGVEACGGSCLGPVLTVEVYAEQADSQLVLRRVHRMTLCDIKYRNIYRSEMGRGTDNLG